MRLHTSLLGDVAEFVRGITFKPDDVVPLASDVSAACMRTKNVQSELDLTDVWGIPQSLIRRDDQYLSAGDLLVSSANSWNLVGKCCWVPELPWQATFGGFVSVLRADRAKIEPRYLYHWFSSPRVQTTVRSFGQQTTNISNLNIERCLGLEIHTPSLPEQRRIAAVLDQAEALRAKRRAALAQLDALNQSIFLDLVGDPVSNSKGWPESTLLGDVADIVSGITKGRKLNNEKVRAVPYLAVANVQDHALNLAAIKSIEATEKEIARYRLLPNDLVLTEGGDPDKLGRGTLWKAELSECIHQNHIFRVRLASDRIAPLFVSWLIGGPRGKRYFLKSAKQTTGIASINMTQLRSFPLLIPPISLQQEFVSRVTAVEALKDAQRASLAELDALFTTLRHRAFRGELFRSETRSSATAAPTADVRQSLKLDTDKGLEALIYVASRTPDHDLYKALKTLYVGDCNHLAEYGSLIYGETHCALPMGPVPQAAYDAARVLSGEMLLSAFPDPALRAALRRTPKQLIPLRAPDLTKLGEDERKSLDRAIQLCAPMSMRELMDLTHDAAYKKTASNQPIRIEDIMAMFSEEAQQRFRSAR